MEPQLFILPDSEAGPDGDADAADGRSPQIDMERTSDAPAAEALPPPVEFSPPPRWRLDDRTKAIGRRGIAQARAALRAATQAAAEQDRSAA